ncbi:hypothetical protein GQ53DRAFT_616102, partial [Thozetella sp. PMI_491]
SKSNKDISYDVKTPPSTGCEDVVSDLQRKLIEAYSERLKGIRYANIWGYLETENKGDAAIWSAQQILLSILGIETMEACRFMDKGCDIEKFRAKLEEHRPHSAIIMAGGGNFNDYYWEDQPSRMAMIEAFTNVSVRAFPQSIHMKISDRINKTKVAFEKHKDLQLAARDRPSHDWLVKTFGNSTGIQSDLVPDIAFMWGNRPDFRLNGNKTHDLLILARKDLEISKGDSSKIAFGKGTIDLGGDIGNITYHKVDWKFTSTPGIDAPKKKPAASEAKKPDSNDEKKPDAKDDKKPDTKDDKKPGAKDDKKPNIKDTIEFKREEGKNQRAWAKSVAGFELLGSARFVITDRLHGHILSTIIGVPHVLMDSKLGKNINFHDTWTRDCACTRVASNIDEALEIARLWFEEEKKTI